VSEAIALCVGLLRVFLEEHVNCVVLSISSAGNHLFGNFEF
jgi:hypothetical protein